MSSFVNDLYNGAASLGQTESYIHLIIGGILSLILIAIAIHLLFINQSDLIDSTAIITDSHCVPNYENKGGVTYNCDLRIKYTVDGKPYSGQISSTSSTSSYAAGDSVAITYNSTNPNEVTSYQIRDKTLAYILLVVGILIAGCVYYNYYMTSHSKIYAASEGAADGLNLIGNAFRIF
jgi:hypothetical protein